MKTSKFIILAAAAFMAVGCGNGAGSMKPVMGPDSTLVSAPSNGLRDTVSYFLGVSEGMMLKNYKFDIDYSLFVKGMKDAVACEDNPQDSTFASNFKIDPTSMNSVINEYLRLRNAYQAAVNAAEEVKFLASKEKEDGVQKTESGLLYKVEVEGGEKPVSEKDTVYVHYKGTRPDGSVFDETEDDAPSRKFLLNRVIKGWNEGIQLVGEGGKIKLYVPSKLGYGERGTRDIEPCTPLTFEVTLDSLKHYIAPVEDEKK